MGDELLTICQTYVITDTGIAIVDTLIIDGKRWIVPVWLDESPPTGFSKPSYMIRVDKLRGQWGQEPGTLQHPLPTPVLEGKTMPGYEVELRPNLYVRRDPPGVVH